MHNGWCLIDQLVQQGVFQFCIAPGSRNTPLALAIANHPKAKHVVHFDERGAAFYALGWAKGSKKPAVAVSTSGTAAAHFFAAALEALHSKTPLLLLTADRPCELHHTGANQTMDQIKLFTSGVKWQMNLAPDLDEKTMRSIAVDAYFQSMTNPPGPVHLNCPFREPLYTKTNAASTQGTQTPLFFPKLICEPISVQTAKGVILLGQIPTDPTPVLKLAEKIQWPLFADILSNARSHPTSEQIRHFDYCLRSEDAPQPELILHIGERMTSKTVLDWSKKYRIFHVSPYPYLQDPERVVSCRIQSDIESFCATFEASTDPLWLAQWQLRDQAIAKLLERHFQSPSTEAHALRQLRAPDQTALFFGNGMAIRDADHFFFPQHAVRFYANRGLSGIDGNIATAAGLCDALGCPVIAWIGDQAALHDSNSLPLIKGRKLLLIISNNFGGGIFSHLPIAASPHFESLFAASHSWHFEQIAEMFKIPYRRVDAMPVELPSSGILEIVSDRIRNHAFQNELAALCSQRIN